MASEKDEDGDQRPMLRPVDLRDSMSTPGSDAESDEKKQKKPLPWEEKVCVCVCVCCVCVLSYGVL